MKLCVHGSKEGELFGYKRQKDSGEMKREVTHYGKDERESREKRQKEKKHEKRGNTCKCVLCQRGWVWVWKQIPTNTEKEKQRICFRIWLEEKKETSVLTQ